MRCDEQAAAQFSYHVNHDIIPDRTFESVSLHAILIFPNIHTHSTHFPHPLYSDPFQTQGHLRCAFRNLDLDSLTTSEPYCLAVLLQFGDELIALLDDVIVLLVLVVGSVGLDDALARDAIDSAGDALCGDEFGEITMREISIAHGEEGQKRQRDQTYRSRKSTVTPNSLAILSSPTTR